MKEIALPTQAKLTSALVPDLSLSYGQVVWLLETTGFSAGALDPTFQHYIKSLRKIGLPFRRGEPGLDCGRLARYAFDHVMDLAVALHLRVYGTLPDAVAEGLIAARATLHGFYRRAYLEHATGLGARIEVTAQGRSGFAMSGVWLDLRLRYAGGRCLGFGPPRLLSPFEALRVFATADEAARAHSVFNLSELAVRLVAASLRCPGMRDMRRKASRTGQRASRPWEPE
ncbi:hypothetical protein [Acidiphilium sp.]|uniref:hypothetical protein n=1 Tax=Acidiphilium sp. TaxID=527 RepID=UPI00230F3FA3|nr:hypothetical protein [Acidiphilium sp.]MDA8248551.1 hypothetical protein [Rhodospirillales bacterium]